MKRKVFFFLLLFFRFKSLILLSLLWCLIIKIKSSWLFELRQFAFSLLDMTCSSGVKFEELMELCLHFYEKTKDERKKHVSNIFYACDVTILNNKHRNMGLISSFFCFNLLHPIFYNLSWIRTTASSSMNSNWCISSWRRRITTANRLRRCSQRKLTWWIPWLRKEHSRWIVLLISASKRICFLFRNATNLRKIEDSRAAMTTQAKLMGLRSWEATGKAKWKNWNIGS